MPDKQIITDDVVNAEDFCPYFRCEIDCYEATMCPWFVDTLQELQAKEQECEELIGQRDKLEFGNNILEHERNRYKQALERIKHILEKYFDDDWKATREIEKIIEEQ